VTGTFKQAEAAIAAAEPACSLEEAAKQTASPQERSAGDMETALRAAFGRLAGCSYLDARPAAKASQLRSRTCTVKKRAPAIVTRRRKWMRW
jgi:hypothetical protein